MKPTRIERKGWLKLLRSFGDVGTDAELLAASAARFAKHGTVVQWTDTPEAPCEPTAGNIYAAETVDR